MQTIGERLEEARKKKGISIREAAESTKIRGDYLQKFESNHFDIGLTEIYTRGFLRTYANFLKVPADRIINDYTALGRGEVRPRQPSREIYGRMDISVATANEASDRAAPPPENASAEPSPARNQPRFPRGGTSLPTGPDPAQVFKYVKIAGAVLAAIVVIWIVKGVISDKAGSAAARTVAANPPAREPFVTLLALNTVQVKVHKIIPGKVGPESYGEVLFDSQLGPGEKRDVLRTTGLYITASACENLHLVINGKEVGMGKELVGYATGQLPLP